MEFGSNGRTVQHKKWQNLDTTWPDWGNSSNSSVLHYYYYLTHRNQKWNRKRNCVKEMTFIRFNSFHARSLARPPADQPNLLSTIIFNQAVFNKFHCCNNWSWQKREAFLEFLLCCACPCPVAVPGRRALTPPLHSRVFCRKLISLRWTLLLLPFSSSFLLLFSTIFCVSFTHTHTHHIHITVAGRSPIGNHRQRHIGHIESIRFFLIAIVFCHSDLQMCHAHPARHDFRVCAAKKKNHYRHEMETMEKWRKSFVESFLVFV